MPNRVALVDTVLGSDPRRGPVYSLLIAYCLKWGEFFSLMLVQHLPVRSRCSQQSWFSGSCTISGWLAYRCSIAYPFMPGDCRRHIVRNESVIFLVATATLVAAFTALRRDRCWH